jgi:hypothetical protein
MPTNTMKEVRVSLRPGSHHSLFTDLPNYLYSKLTLATIFLQCKLSALHERPRDRAGGSNRLHKATHVLLLVWNLPQSAIWFQLLPPCGLIVQKVKELSLFLHQK